jgi:hypothetical protein
MVVTRLKLVVRLLVTAGKFRPNSVIGSPTDLFGFKLYSVGVEVRMITKNGESSQSQGRIITLGRSLMYGLCKISDSQGMFIIDSFATIDGNRQEVMADHPDEVRVSHGVP